MANRMKPKYDSGEVEGITDYTFAAFEKWADENDIGVHEEDWGIWFDCWFDGYCKGAEDWKD
jgi:hypothetical protein